VHFIEGGWRKEVAHCAVQGFLPRFVCSVYKECTGNIGWERTAIGAIVIFGDREIGSAHIRVTVCLYTIERWRDPKRPLATMV
jgi:hypothetical protein